MAQLNRQPMSVPLSRLRHPIFTHRISSTHAGSATASLPLPCFTHADAAPPYLPPSVGAAQPHLVPPRLLPHGSRRYSAARPPSSCSWLRALSLPSCPSLHLAAAPSDPPQMTQAVPDPVGMSEEVAAWPLPIDFLCFLVPRRRHKNYGA